jgi:hypothetical protein
MKKVPAWPLCLIALPAAVAVWSGWVGLGRLAGFGDVQPLPGILPWHLDTAITLPVGVEAYGAYALGAWLSPGVPDRAKSFARRSAIGSLALGMLGQVSFHVLASAHATRAPWPVTVAVACMPVLTLGFGVGLAHLLRSAATPVTAEASEPSPAAHPEAIIPGTTAAVTASKPKAAKRRSNARSRRGGSIEDRRARRAELEAQAVVILSTEPGIGPTALAARLDCSVSTARRILTELRAEQPAAA